MKALVTGGGGFLGRAIVERLRGQGHEVTVLGRGRYPEIEALGARTVQADVADGAAVAAALRGQDVVFHAAARAGVWGPAADYRRTNVEGTRAVLQACAEAGVGRLVFTSSPSVVFDGRDHEGVSEVAYPASYEAIYPQTKAEAERLVLAAHGPALSTVALRPHLIWGPRDPHLLPRLFDRARRGRLRVVGSGRNRVSVSYVDNAAAAHVQAAEALARGTGGGRAYFVNDPEPVELWPWLSGLLAAVGLPGPRPGVSLGTARAVGAGLEMVWRGLGLGGEPPLTRFVAAQLASSHWYDVGPARRDLGYDPPVTADEALARTVAWWRPRLSSGEGWA